MNPSGAMTEILSKILAHKREEISQSQQRFPLSGLERRIRDLPRALDFAQALYNPARVGVIAEMKKASPSAGVLRAQYEPSQLAERYQRNGAAAVSVLTDERFFQGRLDHLGQARRACRLPLLRKDFVIDPYQVCEARAVGADAILLIVAALERAQLESLLAATGEYGVQALVEIHNEKELELALAAGANIIGVNNRNLRNFEISLDTTARLAPWIPPDRIKVAESGIRSRADVEWLARLGIDAVLVGSHLMSQPDPGGALQQLIGVPRS